ncbi:MAG TPA: class I SAM-dependent methyltransferase [Caulobacteraceae bacterium]|nr:class I SAM-dependent methyltransferase [Caulobacteraceae bacterium]
MSEDDAKDAGPTPEPRRAFAADARAYAAAAAAKAVWWGAAGMFARALAKPARATPSDFTLSADPPPDGFVRRAWLSAFEKEAADVAAGLYPAMDDRPADPLAAIRRTLDVIADARAVEARRRRGDGAEVRAQAPATYPAYYRQNFHYQSGGWFTAESAGRYEAQVEALFAGTAGAMRRRALSLLVKAWRARDHRGLAILDLACGAGAFLHDLGVAFPRSRLLGADLSPAYLAAARASAPGAALFQAKAEQLPLADASLDALTAVYLFHELPPTIRIAVAAETARVLKPGGLFAVADSIQPADEPRLARLLEAFPAYFHEPYYAGYAKTDLSALFGAAGLKPVAEDSAFLTKAMVFEKS